MESSSDCDFVVRPEMSDSTLAEPRLIGVPRASKARMSVTDDGRKNIVGGEDYWLDQKQGNLALFIP